MYRNRITSRLAFLLAAATLTACDGAPSTPAGPPSSVSYSPGNALSSEVMTVDTVMIKVSTAEGGGAAGVQVQVNALDETGFVPLRLSASPGAATAISVVLSTGSRGTVPLYVHTGTAAGTARAVVTIPALQRVDTLTVQIRPGAPVTFSPATADTALYPGASFEFWSYVDRYGNPSPTALTFDDPSVARYEDGTVVAVGYGYATATLVGSDGTPHPFHVSVVPQGTLAVQARVTLDAAGTLIVNMDGSKRRLLGLYLQYASWAPDGNTLAFSPFGGPVFGAETRRMYTMTADGANLRRMIPEPSPFGPSYQELGGLYSRNGAWFYFTVREGPSWIWRMHPDGTDLQQVTPDRYYPVESAASPSADGSRIVYNSSGGTGDPAHDSLLVRNVDTGAKTLLMIGAGSARWSPVGDQIAYFTTDSNVALINPDGTGRRTLTTGGNYYRGMAWSPDGRWIVASGGYGGNYLDLIEVATAKVIPLPFSAGMYAPAWRP